VQVKGGQEVLPAAQRAEGIAAREQVARLWRTSLDGFA